MKLSERNNVFEKINPSPRKDLTDLMPGDMIGDGRFLVVNDRRSARIPGEFNGMKCTWKRGYIARTGNSVVYPAYDTFSGQRSAIKLSNHKKDPLLQMYDHCERSLSQQLNHPNVMRAVEVGYYEDDEGRQINYLATRQALDGTLEEYCRTLGEPETLNDVGDVWKLLMDAAEGLDYLHDNHIIHRDVKPSNIFLDEDVAYIGDLGIVASSPDVVDETAHDNVITLEVEDQPVDISVADPLRIAGTTGFIAPEVERGRGVTEECDSYGWGMTAYKALSGNKRPDLPTRRNTQGDVITSFSPDNVIFLPKIVPRACKEVIAQCLAPDPQDRPGFKQILAVAA